MGKKDGFNWKEETHSKPHKTESLFCKLWIIKFHKKFICVHWHHLSYGTIRNYCSMHLNILSTASSQYLLVKQIFISACVNQDFKSHPRQLQHRYHSLCRHYFTLSCLLTLYWLLRQLQKHSRKNLLGLIACILNGTFFLKVGMGVMYPHYILDWKIKLHVNTYKWIKMIKKCYNYISPL